MALYGALAKDQNLSDLTDPNLARVNLGVAGPVRTGPTGKYRYVDPANSTGVAADVVQGGTKAAPFLTLDYAIGQCVADRGDVLECFPGSHAVTSTVEFDVAGITVVAADLGYPPAVAAESFMINTGASFTDGPAATITQPCRIIGMGFASRNLTGEACLIDCEEAGGFSGGFILLQNCRFPTWYGAIDYGLRTIGGAENHIVGCVFDGLFVGFDVAAIGMQNDAGGQAPFYTRVIGNRFEGVGTGKFAIKFITGAVPVEQLYHGNWLVPGASAVGNFVDNNSVVSTGMISDNWLNGASDKTDAMSNSTNSVMTFNDNHYDE